MPTLLRVAPEIPVVDLQSSLRHYDAALGFSTVASMPERQYAIVERDGVSLHLFEVERGAHAPASMHVFANGLDALLAELRGRGARVTQEIKHQPWGNRDFRITDLSGNEIKFTEPLV